MDYFALSALVLAINAIGVAGQLCGSQCSGIQSCIGYTDVCRCPAGETIGANCDVAVPTSCATGKASVNGVCYNRDLCWGANFAKCCPSINAVPCSGNGVCSGWGTNSPVCRCQNKATGTRCRPMTLTHQLPQTDSLSVSLSRTVTFTATATVTLSISSTRSKTLSRSRNTHSRTPPPTRTAMITHSLSLSRSPSKTSARTRRTLSATVTHKTLAFTATPSILFFECYFGPQSKLKSETLAKLLSNPNKGNSALASRMQRYLASSVVLGDAFSMPITALAGALLGFVLTVVINSVYIEDIPEDLKQDTILMDEPGKVNKTRKSKKRLVIPPTAGMLPSTEYHPDGSSRPYYG